MSGFHWNLARSRACVQRLRYADHAIPLRYKLCPSNAPNPAVLCSHCNTRMRASSQVHKYQILEGEGTVTGKIKQRASQDKMIVT